jgi:hypothetical protein
VLEDAGLVSTSRDGKTRPRSLRPAALTPVADWTETMRRQWEARHDRLATYLTELQEAALTPKDTP